MRKILISAVAVGTALSFAAPAAAQWAPPVYRYAPYNYVNRFSSQQFAGAMQARVQRIRSDVRAMQSRRILSWGEARSLDVQARNLQRQIYNESRNGIQRGEARRIENGIRRLENRVAREAADWNTRPGRHRY
jgi:hypothetical protein